MSTLWPTGLAQGHLTARSKRKHMCIIGGQVSSDLAKIRQRFDSNYISDSSCLLVVHTNCDCNRILLFCLQVLQKDEQTHLSSLCPCSCPLPDLLLCMYPSFTWCYSTSTIAIQSLSYGCFDVLTYITAPIKKNKKHTSQLGLTLQEPMTFSMVNIHMISHPNHTTRPSR